MSKLVYLDPGHSKLTPGKRSFDNTLLEYEFNRDIAARTKYLLSKYGIRVEYTTYDEDADLSLSKRCAKANAAKADIFVSIHANAAGSTWNSASGWEVYTYNLAKENVRLAKCVHDTSISILKLRDRGVRTADFGVLRMSHMPAILIEHGFYTNKEECAKLKDPTFRHKCAVANTKGILNYFGIANDLSAEEVKNEIKKPEPIDYTKHWAYTTYKTLNDKGITISEMNFNDTSTRAEAFVLLARVIEKITGTKIDSIKFEDDKHWACKYYSYLKYAGVEIKTPNYGDAITRAEIFTLLSHILNRKNPVVLIDKLETDHWALKYYNDVVNTHKMVFSDVRLEDSITRGELLAVILKLYNYYSK